MAHDGTNGVDHVDRCVGTLLWKACSDALGALVEGMDAAAIAAAYPQGVTRYVANPRGAGCYTDDTQMAVGLARALVDKGRIDAQHASLTYARLFDMGRGYGGNAMKILAELQANPQATDWASLATKYSPEGSFANGGAMRIAPVGLAYRHAPPPVVLAAVRGALALTHVHPVAVDGALVQAEAVAWLCRQPSPALPMPQQEQVAFLNRLLSHLIPVASTEGMRAKLVTLQKVLLQERPQALSPALPPGAASQQLGGSTPPAPVPGAPAGLSASACAQLGAFWPEYLKSEQWAQELRLALEMSRGQFQIRADDAVAVALCAFVHHGLSALPASAVVAATHYGGDTDTTAAMAGALCGALHGTSHLPLEWWGGLENSSAEGRDGITALARQLAPLDCRE